MRPLIRDASPFDIPIIIDLLIEYRKEMPYSFLDECNDADHVRQMLTNMIAGNGMVLIAETEKIIGFLIAGISPSAWSHKLLLLMEYAYWVEPESRGSSAGYRLLTEYKNRAVKMKEEGRICKAIISKMVNSPNLKYEKFGFQKLEEFWVM